MTTLQDLKTEYQNKIDTQASEQARQEQEREALRQLKLDGLKPRIITWIANREGVDEAELNQYGEISADWDDWNEKMRHATFTLTLPDHQPVTFTFYEDTERAIRPNNKWWKVDQSGRSPETLGEALTIAYQVYWDNQDYMARETVESQEYEAYHAAKREEDEREQKQREDTLIELAKDPVAFLLLELFAKIKQERVNLRDEIDNLSEALNNTEYRYDEELSATRRKIEQERQEIERVKDESSNLRYEVEDLGEELRKAKKQGGGW